MGPGASPRPDTSRPRLSCPSAAAWGESVAARAVVASCEARAARRHAQAPARRQTAGGLTPLIDDAYDADDAFAFRGYNARALFLVKDMRHLRHLPIPRAL